MKDIVDLFIFVNVVEEGVSSEFVFHSKFFFVGLDFPAILAVYPYLFGREKF